MIAATAQFIPRSDLGRFVSIHVSPAVRLGGDEIAGKLKTRMQQLCPVDTGALQASIDVQVEELPHSIRWRVGPHMSYAPYVEWGTGIAGASSPGAGDGPYSKTWPGMPAQPFVRPALDEVKPEAKDIFATHLKVGLAA